MSVSASAICQSAAVQTTKTTKRRPKTKPGKEGDAAETAEFSLHENRMLLELLSPGLFEV